MSLSAFSEMLVAPVYGALSIQLRPRAAPAEATLAGGDRVAHPGASPDVLLTALP